MKTVALILGLLFFVGVACNQSNKIKNSDESMDEILEEHNMNKQGGTYISELVFDSLLIKPQVDFLIFKTKHKEDTVDVFCNCEKDIKNNRIIIQIRKEFPTLSELIKNGYSGRGILIGPDYPIQVTFLTISIKDSLVEFVKIHRQSQEQQFNKMFKTSAEIKKYKISLNKNKYNIAQNIWGEFEFILPIEFGIHANDTIIKGYFNCNNSKIEKFTENTPYPRGKKFKINTNLTFQEKSKYKSENIYNEINPWECDCKMNSTRDTLFISNSHGDDLSGDNLTIKLTNQLNPDFIYESWTDCCGDYSLNFSFNKYNMELNKNPFENGINNLVGIYWIATDTIPKLYGERLIKKGIFKCK